MKDTSGRVGRRELAQQVAASTQGFTEEQVYLLIGTLTSTITGELAKGNSVNIAGFGTWKPTERKSRNGINPQTRERITISPKKTATFSWGEHASSLLAGGLAGGGVGGQGKGGRGKV